MQFIFAVLLWGVFAHTAALPDRTKEGDFCPVLFKDCGSVAGKINAVSFNGTCSQGIAILKKGTTVLIDFNFSSTNDEGTLTSKVHGQIEDLPWVNFPLDNPDACKDSGLVCPIKGSSIQDYKPVLRILSAYPPVDVKVKWELQNKAGQDVFCILMPATITS